MLPLLVCQNPHVSVNVQYPSDWHAVKKCVPKLVIPRELFAISNRPIVQTPLDSSQPRPMIQALSARDMFVWCYSQVPGDPDPVHPDAVPDYSRYSMPLRYLESEVFPSTDAREWDSSDFLWRRVGFDTDGVVVTVWVWEGTKADAPLISAAEEIVGSVRLGDF